MTCKKTTLQLVIAAQIGLISSCGQSPKSMDLPQAKKQVRHALGFGWQRSLMLCALMFSYWVTVPCDEYGGGFGGSNRAR